MNGDVQHISAEALAGYELKQITPAQFDELEKWMLAQPQAESPVTHLFAGGLYVREVKLAAGALALGHNHKASHHCVVLKGRMTLLAANGTVTEVVAPCTFTGQPGRKLVLVHEAVVMQNVHPTGDWPAECLNDIEAMENHLCHRSQFWNQKRLEDSDRVEQEQQ